MYPRLAWFQMNRFTLHYQWSPYPWPEASSICIIVITEFTQHIRTYDFQTRTHSVLGFELSVWISWQSRTSSPLAFSSTLWDSGDVGDQTLYTLSVLFLGGPRRHALVTMVRGPTYHRSLAFHATAFLPVFPLVTWPRDIYSGRNRCVHFIHTIAKWS